MKKVKRFFSMKNVMLVTAIVGCVVLVSIPTRADFTSTGNIYNPTYTMGIVGIGTSDVRQTLHVKNPHWVQAKFQSTLSNYPGGIELWSGDDTGKWEIQALSSSDPGFLKGGFLIYDRNKDCYALGINANGNVGIGTTNPLQTLHIQNSSYVQGRFQSKTPNYAGGIEIMSGDATGRWEIQVPSIHGAGPFLGGLFFYNRVNNKYAMGINANGNVDFAGTTTSVNYACSSDARYKKNINPIRAALSKVLQLNGITYDWKIDEYKEKGFTGDKQIGLLAQNVETVLPELVHTDKTGYKSVSYDKIVAVLVEAMKELKAENDQLKKQIASLETMNARIAKLEAQLKEKRVSMR